ncbi:DnaT-like ssDNA-binding domain-containing protein [Pectobacterium sp. 21LCBS03]|uniref:DnaT-like ssDNA-binding domain-containing protein n=1 Tax=Pectobacterium sp. 21LCBS03 TaxID=2935858 RepID=UPI00200F91C9|nr:DnaT-like ssDNA-binding domain-containing protein [Pectobacterium sp. 21LCBS03]UPY96246.1 DnaT-like ssDNA-binding domain-containing protein [Pectobacterium sp. 21LCBS03]
MARIRTIKPEFWTDEDMAEVSECACLLAIGLLNYADDDGYFNANTKLIKAAVFPIREPSVPITVMLRELSNHGYLSMFSTPDGRHFGLINNFAKHQVVNKKKDSKIKEMDLIPYEYGIDTVGVPVGMDQGSGNGKEETPHIAREENLPPDKKNGLPEYVPGVDEPIGKFPMFSDWRPSFDFRQRVALAGVILDEDYQPTELAGFVMYWQPEGKAFYQMQWEQKFARHIQQVRSAAVKQKTGGSNAGTQQVTSSGESRAMQKFREAKAQRYGADAGQLVGGDDRAVHGSMDSEERHGTIITVDSGDRPTDGNADR